MIFDLIIHLVPKSWVQKGEGQKVSFSCFKTACKYLENFRPSEDINKLQDSFVSKLYIPSTLNIDLILWHTQSIVCAAVLDRRRNFHLRS